MRQVHCINCTTKIEPKNIDISKDTAHCENCETTNSLSFLLNNNTNNSESAPKPTQTATNRPFKTHNTVSGVEVIEDEFGWSVEVTHRSWHAIYLVPFAIYLVGTSVSDIYGFLIETRRFDIEQLLFVAVFLIFAVAWSSVALMSVFGRTLITLRYGKAELFSGIGSAGRHIKFDWRDIHLVREVEARRFAYLVLDGRKTIRLAYGLSAEKIYFLATFLNSKLLR